MTFRVKILARLTSQLSLFIILNSCNNRNIGSHINLQASLNGIEMPFNVEQSIFLNQYTNPASGVTSWIIADSSFVKHHKTISHFLDNGGEGNLSILHWSRTDDPEWIGARIPGKLIFADLLMYENDSFVVKQQYPGGRITTASGIYKKELEQVLRNVGKIYYP